GGGAPATRPDPPGAGCPSPPHPPKQCRMPPEPDDVTIEAALAGGSIDREDLALGLGWSLNRLESAPRRRRSSGTRVGELINSFLDQLASDGFPLTPPSAELRPPQARLCVVLTR